AIMMVECGSQEVPEDVMIAAIKFGHDVNRQIIAIQDELIRRVAKPKMQVVVKTTDPEVDSAVRAFLEPRMAALDAPMGKRERREAEQQIRADVQAQFAEQFPPDQGMAVYEKVEEVAFRAAVLDHGRRPDGRTTTEIRPLSAAVGIL